MTQDMIDKLPKELNKMKTLKRISADTTNGQFMVESTLKVINFDLFSREYSSKFHIPVQPKTNDALYIDQFGKWFFIEFKNGSLKQADIYRKIYDSLIMLNEFGLVSWDFCRKNITYILVYNEDEYNEQYVNDLQKSTSRTRIHTAIRNKANKARQLYGIDKLKGYMFEDTYTYNEMEFITNFVEKYETMEGIS